MLLWKANVTGRILEVCQPVDVHLVPSGEVIKVVGIEIAEGGHTQKLVTDRGRSYFPSEVLLRFQGDVASGGTPIWSPIAGRDANVTSAMLTYARALPNGLLARPNYNILPWPLQDLHNTQWRNLLTLELVRVELKSDGFNQLNLHNASQFYYPNPLGFWMYRKKFYVENLFRVDQLTPKWQLDWAVYCAELAELSNDLVAKATEIALARQLAKEHNLPLPEQYQVPGQIEMF